jgi:hypothetical protein
MEDREGAYRVLVGRPKKNLEDLGIDGRILLNISSRSGMRRHELE